MRHHPHGHPHHSPHRLRHGHPRGPMSRLGNFIRARLRRRLFLWFGVSIFTTALVVGTVMTVMGGLMGEGSWHQEAIRARTFVSNRLAEVWDDPVRRDALVRSVSEDLLVNVGYSQEHVNVSASDDFGGVLLANRFLSGVTSSVRLSLTYDKRNNRLFPSKGFIHYGSVEYAPNFLGGSFLFTRYTAYSRLYFPLPLGAVFKTNATVGYIQQLDANRPLPISELYYLGGINSVRGYLLRSISPSLFAPSSGSPDASIERLNVGGNKQLILNLELEFPVFEKAGIRGVVFFDAGNAFAVNEPFFTDRQDQNLNLPLGLFTSVGFGFRWFSPVGPLRFEWGIPLNKRAEDEPVLFEFTIGNFF